MLGERRKYLSKINCEHLSSISCVTFGNENFQKSIQLEYTIFPRIDRALEKSAQAG